MFNGSGMVDVIAKMVGKKLGEGCSRTVFAVKGNPDIVVKVQHETGFHNVFEWKLYEDAIIYPNIVKWLAPCVSISPCGLILIQRRTKPLTKSQIKKLPKKLPKFLTDTASFNFGMLDGRLVCHDYALHEIDIPDKKTTVNWFD